MKNDKKNVWIKKRTECSNTNKMSVIYMHYLNTTCPSSYLHNGFMETGAPGRDVVLR